LQYIPSLLALLLFVTRITNSLGSVQAMTCFIHPSSSSIWHMLMWPVTSCRCRNTNTQQASGLRPTPKESDCVHADVQLASAAQLTARDSNDGVKLCPSRQSCAGQYSTKAGSHATCWQSAVPTCILQLKDHSTHIRTHTLAACTTSSAAATCSA
jgi:hypothetical protein